MGRETCAGAGSESSESSQSTQTTQSSEPGDRGDMVLSWIVKIAVVLAIIGVIGFDSVTTIQSKVTISDQANTAAMAAVTTYSQTHNVQAAYQAALADAQASNPANTIAPAQFSVTGGGIVTLTLDRPVHTVVAHYLPITSAKLAVATATAEPVS